MLAARRESLQEQIPGKVIRQQTWVRSCRVSQRETCRQELLAGSGCGSRDRLHHKPCSVYISWSPVSSETEQDKHVSIPLSVREGFQGPWTRKGSQLDLKEARSEDVRDTLLLCTQKVRQ